MKMRMKMRMKNNTNMEKYGVKISESNLPDRISVVGDGSFKSALKEYRRMARNAWRNSHNFMQVEFALEQKMSWWRGNSHHYIEIITINP